jgi:hypothetical protein
LTELIERGWLRVESRSTGSNASQIVRLRPDFLHDTDTEEAQHGGVPITLDNPGKK